MKSDSVPVVGFVARSGTGKTTLLTRLIPLLSKSGVRVGLIKHSHHDFAVDIPGKDSHELRMAGASPVMITSQHRRAIITEINVPRERGLEEELTYFDTSEIDLVIVEGYKSEHIPKIELHRPSLGYPLTASGDPDIIAIASDEPISEFVQLPVLDLNRPDDIAGFLLNWLKQSVADSTTHSRREH